jgi:hypothetical protein
MNAQRSRQWSFMTEVSQRQCQHDIRHRIVMDAVARASNGVGCQICVHKGLGIMFWRVWVVQHQNYQYSEYYLVLI